METINFQPIFDYIDYSINPLKSDTRRIDKKVDAIQITVDKLVQDNKTFREELLISSHRTDRLDVWAKKAADKIDLPLSF